MTEDEKREMWEYLSFRYRHPIRYPITHPTKPVGWVKASSMIEDAKQELVEKVAQDVINRLGKSHDK